MQVLDRWKKNHHLYDIAQFFFLFYCFFFLNLNFNNHFYKLVEIAKYFRFCLLYDLAKCCNESHLYEFT
jgi:hypothetical protein